MSNSTLADLKPEQPAEVVAIDGRSVLKRRLLEFGFVPGARVMVRMISKFSDPLDITIRYGRVSLRRSEAALIRVRLL